MERKSHSRRGELPCPARLKSRSPARHRTSGTEPKIKYYLEGSGKDASAVAKLLPKVVEELSDSWMEAEKNGLGRP